MMLMPHVSINNLHPSTYFKVVSTLIWLQITQNTRLTVIEDLSSFNHLENLHHHDTMHHPLCSNLAIRRYARRTYILILGSHAFPRR